MQAAGLVAGKTCIVTGGAGSIGLATVRTLLAEGAKVMPIGIALGADGNFWFTEKAANRVGRISPDGTIAEFAMPTAKASPDGIALGPDGNIWCSEGNIDRLARVTPDGRVSELGVGMT